MNRRLSNDPSNVVPYYLVLQVVIEWHGSSMKKRKDIDGAPQPPHDKIILLTGLPLASTTQQIALYHHLVAWQKFFRSVVMTAEPSLAIGRDKHSSVIRSAMTDDILGNYGIRFSFTGTPSGNNGTYSQGILVANLWIKINY